MTQSQIRVAGLLLAGGEGRRMGGVDKGLLLFQGQALFCHALQRLVPQTDWLAISANRHLADYAGSGYPVLADDAAWQGMGPLAGVATLAAVLPAPITHVQLLPCDTPWLPHDLVARQLAALVVSPTLQGCLPYTDDGPQPVCALLRRDALQGLPAYLAAGGRSLRGFFATLQMTDCHFGRDAFANLNDPAALQAMAARRD